MAEYRITSIKVTNSSRINKHIEFYLNPIPCQLTLLPFSIICFDLSDLVDLDVT